MFNGMTPSKLVDILAAVEPVELKGLALIRRRRLQPGQWFPADVSPRLLAEAATEMMDYMSGCERAMENLKRLPPVPSAAQIEEWPL